MKREELLKKLTSVGVVSVVRADTPAKAVKIADAVITGGVKGIELTYTVPHADSVINDLVEKHGNDALIGAGTVLDATSARLAISAGAEFIVSPTFDIEVAKMCNLRPLYTS
ncbi:MAG TPA: bifunctional 2-keto-4-hydroxyglutarate aldolase/2-keto-3-deoxy-6-phosphogluconate aldolase, partial [Lactobacillus sp.]|nr:bifunctional 2-keto-4-hydroxyglutarate aldolase/2-keto-3-deoxy-6-phosphogluconate aldolase [Lactobacillus sp.]